MKVYGCSNNPFPYDFGSPALILPPIPIDDSPCLNKRFRFASDPLPDAIYSASVNYVIILTTPSEPPQVIPLNYFAPNTHNTIISYTLSVTVQR